MFPTPPDQELATHIGLLFIEFAKQVPGGNWSVQYLDRPAGLPVLLWRWELEGKCFEARVDMVGSPEYLVQNLVAEARARFAQLGNVDRTPINQHFNAGGIERDVPIWGKNAEGKRPNWLYWLIERGQAVHHTPTIWWCGGDERAGLGEDEMKNWTQDAMVARRFVTRAAAEELASKLFGGGSYVVTEHVNV